MDETLAKHTFMQIHFYAALVAGGCSSKKLQLKAAGVMPCFLKHSVFHTLCEVGTSRFDFFTNEHTTGYYAVEGQHIAPQKRRVAEIAFFAGCLAG